jgi:single-strand DNA-binding protein
MASHNRVILMGNLTRDVEVRHTPQGTPVTDLGIAVNDKRKNAAGEWVDEVTFVDITLWGRQAEVAGQYCRKGSPIFVEGRLKLDTWEADGQKKSKLKVIGERIQLLSSRSEGGGRGDDSESSTGGRSSSGNPGSRRVVSSNTINSDNDYYESSSAAHHDDVPAGKRDAQPTGNGPGYHDEDIPF